jgi:3-phenylpropionate/trans-cinnamate dioxygenase ferredoxin component
VRDGEVYLQIPVVQRDEIEISIVEPQAEPAGGKALRPNEFVLAKVGPGEAALVKVGGEDVAVFNVDGQYFATQDACTHEDGPLSDGDLEGKTIICPWHGSCFDVTNGEVLCGPAEEPLKTYRVSIEGEVGRVEAA